MNANEGGKGRDYFSASGIGFPDALPAGRGAAMERTPSDRPVDKPERMEPNIVSPSH
jgi:hypothetical protein